MANPNSLLSSFLLSFNPGLASVIYLMARLIQSSRGMLVKRLSASKETINIPCKDRSLISFTKVKESEAVNVDGI